MGGPPPKAIWPLGVILRPAILSVRCRGGVDAARARGAAESSLRKGGPGAAARASGAHALRVVHKAFRGAGEPGHSLQAVKNRAAITRELAACKTLAIKHRRSSTLIEAASTRAKARESPPRRRCRRRGRGERRARRRRRRRADLFHLSASSAGRRAGRPSGRAAVLVAGRRLQRGAAVRPGPAPRARRCNAAAPSMAAAALRRPLRVLER